MKDFSLNITCKNNELGIHEEDGSGCLYHGLTIEDVKVAIADYLETNCSENVRYIKFSGGTPFCGEDFEEYEAVDLSVTDEQLSQMADDYAKDNAAMYEDIENDYGVDREDYNSEEEYQEALEEFSEEYYGESWGDWIEVSKEEYLENR